jgi:Sulfotransferase domain
MLTRLGYIVNYALGRDIAGRTVYKDPDDIFLVAYPGSGGQWLRRLVANLGDPGHPVTETNILERVPDLYHVSRRGFNRMSRPRVIFSHECFDADCHNNVVYLVRDPRDVAVSIYGQRRRGNGIQASVTMEQFVSTDFMRTDDYQGGWAEDFSGEIKKNRGFFYCSRLKEEFLGTPASWGENVMSWLGARGADPQGLLTLRYEDLFSDAENTLRIIAEFLKLDSSYEKIRAAIEVSRVNANEGWPEPPGKWETNLPPSSVHAIKSTWGPLMAALGYSAGAVRAEGASPGPAGF